MMRKRTGSTQHSIRIRRSLHSNSSDVRGRKLTASLVMLAVKMAKLLSEMDVHDVQDVTFPTNDRCSRGMTCVRLGGAHFRTVQSA